MDELTTDFWAVWQAIAKGLPARLTRAFLLGMAGGALRSHATSLLQSDMDCWLVPGLAVCGIQAELVLLPVDATECMPFLNNLLHRQTSIPLFAFAPLPEDAESLKPQPAPATPQANIIRKPMGRKSQRDFEPDVLPLPPADTQLCQQALVTTLDTSACCLTLTAQDGTFRLIGFDELLGAYSHALCLLRIPQRHTRAAHTLFAIRQWVVFACASPGRVFTAEAPDALIRGVAAEFWNGLAGKERSVQASRLRQVAASFATAALPDEIAAAFTLLYALACASYALPADVEKALLAPPESILSDRDRRELIYLCRAGTRDLKILAAHRLAYESKFPDAQTTLQQLRFDREPWVRIAAARRGW